MDYHRHFGLLLTDFFTGSPFVVELEKDLSLKQQYLDVVIIRKRRGRFVGQLPDGLDDLAEHNLITFKSHHEALDDWALKELTGQELGKTSKEWDKVTATLKEPATNEDLAKTAGRDWRQFVTTLLPEVKPTPP